MNSPSLLLEHLSCVQLTGQLLHAVMTLLDVQAADVQRAFQAVAPGDKAASWSWEAVAMPGLFRKADSLGDCTAGAGGHTSQAGENEEDQLTDNQAQITALVVGRFGVRPDRAFK